MSRPNTPLALLAEPGGESAAIRALILQREHDEQERERERVEILAALRELRDVNREQARDIAALKSMAGGR